MRFMIAIMTLALSGAAGAAEAKKAAADGAALYKAKCASCHGKDGKGSASMAKMFKLGLDALDLTDKATLAKDDAALAKVTADGAGKMPAYKAKLKEGEIAALIAYIRSLAGK